MYGHGQYGKVVRSQSKTCIFANKMYLEKAMCFCQIFFEKSFPFPCFLHVLH